MQEYGVDSDSGVYPPIGPILGLGLDRGGCREDLEEVTEHGCASMGHQEGEVLQEDQGFLVENDAVT